MSLNEFIQHIQSSGKVSFDETMAVIHENYHYQPSEFKNGMHDHVLINAAGTNEGSCKIFAFARLNRLDQNQTLSLFGDYYWKDVLADPNGTGHQNIRQFMKYGWDGISFSSEPLLKKQER